MEIDFIITWVDGSDEEWQNEKNRYKGSSGDQRNNRYRDWDTLRYLLRSIEKNAPWVHKVYLVTCGHLPKWLNTDCEKLVVVNHKDYIPEKFLPTFSSRTIDMNFHRIESLSEHFVYFNDDMILLDKVKPEDFFKRGLPCDTAVLRPAVVRSNQIAKNEKTTEVYLAPIIDMSLINKHFKKHKAIVNNLSKWFSPLYGLESLKTLSLSIWNFFPGIREYHCCYSYLKDTYRKVWELEEEALSGTCMHKFRVNTDYNHWIFSYWQMAEGKFVPRSPKFGTAFSLNDSSEHNEQIFQELTKKRYKLVCINDSVSESNYEVIQNKMTECMNELFPNQSKFEK